MTGSRDKRTSRAQGHPATGRKFKRLLGRPLQAELLEKRELLASDSLIISEFMASNDSALQDQFGLSSDWIEIFNPTDTAISLAGWHLTDDAQSPGKWTFPDVSIDSGQFLIVFASGQNLQGTGGPLHTNFGLNADGEYLGLIKPDMSVAYEFADAYPVQFADVSFGSGAVSTQLLSDSTSISFHVPSAGDAAVAAGAQWAAAGFGDSAWSRSGDASITRGIGYALAASAADFQGQFATDVESRMFLNTGSLWIRQEFEVADPREVDGLLLDIQYDDGFVAYINGQKVAAVNTPQGELGWNAEADVPRRPRRTNSNALQPEQFDVTAPADLVTGTNVLAIHALNDTAFDEELLSRATLTGISLSSDPASAVIGYMAESTPGAANRRLRGGAVQFSADSQLFTEPFVLEITASVPTETIRYTIDGSDPTVASTAYTGPMTIDKTTTVRAASFAADGSPGPILVHSFVQLGDDIAAFSSELPLIVLNSPISRVSTATVSETNVINSFMAVFQPDDAGRTTITTEPAGTTQAGIKRRGSSTAGNPKMNLNVEIRDESGSDSAMELLGMAADADWVFFAPYNFDRTKGIRDSFFYEISNQIGPWASATRFVEVFHNVDGSSLSADDYQGIYVIIEKVQRGEDRVNVPKLGPEHITEPDITGGWIWKVDRADPGDSGFSAGGQTILYVNPKEAEVEAVPEQVQWAKDYFNHLRDVLRNADSTWEEVSGIIDVGSWVDHAIVNILTFNVDAYRLSGYFNKDRGGKLEMGPVWDCDRCMGSEDGRDADPEVWRSRTGDLGTDFFNYPWWRDLYRNQPNFWQAWIDRWFQLREEEISDANMASIVQTMAAQLEEAQPRDTAKWRQTPNGGRYAPADMRNWEGEVVHLRNWLSARAKWIDERFAAPAAITPEGGKFSPGQQIAMSSAAGRVYYTTDGTDPRASGGGVARGVLAYTGPITLQGPTTITTRVFDDSEPVLLNPDREDDPRTGSFWSAPTTAHFAPESFAAAANLRITEVNYNPPQATPSELQALGPDAVRDGIDNNEFEFLELMNVSDQPIELGGVELVRVSAFDGMQGVDFTFADQTLAPGQRVVVVEDVDAFRARFGNGVPIAAGSEGARTQSAASTAGCCRTGARHSSWSTDSAT